MRRICSLAAALVLLAIPASAGAHSYTHWWDRGTSNQVSNVETSTVFPTPFPCGEIVAVDNNPNTDTPRILYLDIPDNDQVVGWGVSAAEFSAHWHFGGAYGAGGFNSDGPTTFWVAFNGYPADETLGVRHSMRVSNSTDRLMKIRADGQLPYLVHRVCPPPGG